MRPFIAISRCAFFLLLSFFLATTTFASGESSDAKFVGELRRLRLFGEAERYCRDRLKRLADNPTAEADVFIELLRTLAMRAANASAAEREALWSETQKTADDFLTAHRDHPRLPLIRFQAALVRLARGDQQRREAEITADAVANRQAQEQLRAAEKALSDSEESLVREIPARRGSTTTAHVLSSDELEYLRARVVLHIAQTRRFAALSHPADSRDRKALLLAALEGLVKIVITLPPDDSLTGRMRVLQAGCLRELGRLEEADRTAELVEREEMDVSLRREALAERMRVLTQAGRAKEALALPEDAKFAAMLTTVEPELELARLEATLSLIKQDASQATTLRKQAAAIAARLESQGAYWGRRADQLLSHDGRSGGGTNADLLARSADNLYLKKQYDEAIFAYDQAAEAAAKSGDAEQAFQQRYKAALIEQQRKRYASAVTRFVRLATESSTHPQAGETHLAACWNMAQQVRTDAALGSQYVAMLEEHRQRWPREASSEQARLWLGNWHQAGSRWEEAFAAYSRVGFSSPQFPQAVVAAAHCAKQRLSREEAEEKSDAQFLEPALTYFRDVLLDNPTSDGSPHPRAVAALALSELLLDHRADGLGEAERTLRGLTSDAVPLTAEQDTHRQSLLIAALAGQSGKRDEAMKLLGELTKATSAERMALADRLERIGRSLPTTSQAEFAAVQLAALEKLEETARVRLLRAEALARSGKQTEALQAFETLAKEQPQNGAVQESYAALLLASDDKASLTAALAKWRQIAAKSPPRSARWFRAKYSVASAQYKLGDKAGAGVLIHYLQESPPGLQGTGWESPFAELLAECEK